jgi:hypothetical protein
MVTLKRKILPPKGRNYFLNDFVPDFSINPHIHYVKISSILDFHKTTISNILKDNNFKLVSNPEIPEGNFEKKLEFQDEDITIDIFYGMRFLEFIKPTILITIHDPNDNILELFDKFFIAYGINYKIKEIELTFDFYTDDVFGLEHFINSHLFLKYQNQRLPSKNFKEETFYTTGRKAAKRTRTYVREVNAKTVVRLELILSRAIIRRIGLTLPLVSIDYLDILQYITFKYMDSEKLIKYLKKSQKDEIEKAYSKKWVTGRLYEKHIETYVNSMLYWELMRQVEMLKAKDKETKLLIGVPNYSRFLLEYHELINIFRRELVGKSFIPKGNKSYSLNI